MPNLTPIEKMKAGLAVKAGAVPLAVPDPAPAPAIEPAAAPPSLAPPAVAPVLAPDSTPTPTPTPVPVPDPASPIPEPVPAPAPAPPAPKPRRQVKLPDPAVEDFIPSQAPPAAPAALETNLSLADADYLETVRFGESEGVIPKGTAELEIKRLNQERTDIESAKIQWQREHPGEIFNSATAELADGRKISDFVGLPAVDPGTKRVLERKKDVAVATAAAKKTSDATIAETDRRLRESKMEGALVTAGIEAEKKILEFVSVDDDAAVDADFKTFARDKGVAALADELPGEGNIVAAACMDAKSQVTEFIALRAGIKPYNDNDPLHATISRLVSEVGSIMESGVDPETGQPILDGKGEDARMRDGKRFLSLERFHSLKPEARNKYFTFSDAEWQDIIIERSARQAQSRISTLRKERSKADESRAKRRPVPVIAAPAVIPASAPVPEAPPASVKLTPAPASPPSGGQPPPSKYVFSFTGRG